MKYVKLGAYRTRQSEVIHISLFMVRRSKWQPCHTHTVNPIRKISITFHVTGLKSVHTIFRDIQIKFVGGVRKSAAHVQIWSFPVARRWRYEYG